jgi:hypothetical protein
VKKDESVVCYQKDFPLPHGTVTEFELKETDIAAKWDRKITKQMSNYKSSF